MHLANSGGGPQYGCAATASEVTHLPAPEGHVDSNRFQHLAPPAHEGLHTLAGDHP